jgi:hypothetical protein
LGAFEFLLPHWDTWFADHDPAASRAVVVQRVLDQLAGVDLNPFAVAITRFRLLVAAARAAGVDRLATLPGFRVPVAVGDALLSRPVQLTLAGIGDETLDAALAHAGAFDDRSLALSLLRRTYAAVVGNPPYVTVKDPAVNGLYRELWTTCHRQYSLGVPFTERFWALAHADRDRPGFVGMITANSFMKREFGRKLVEGWMPRHDVTHVLDTSGAYIPGHGTPTVILLGRNRGPAAATVRMVMGIRGEPSRPAVPEKGHVWSSIVDLLDRPGAQNEYVSVVDLDRSRLAQHPWSIGGGGAAELKELLDTRGAPLERHVELPIGRSIRAGADEAFMADPVRARHSGATEFRGLAIGEEVRDWGNSPSAAIWYPYDASSAESPFLRQLWPLRSLLADRATFQGKMADAGLQWWEYMQHTASAYRTPLSIVFAFVAKDNHFVLDRGGKVFNRSAPVIKLPAGAGEDEHLALVGVLNSAPACFWMKQNFMDKGAAGAGNVGKTEAWMRDYEFDGTKLKQFPVPPGSPSPTPTGSPPGPG